MLKLAHHIDMDGLRLRHLLGLRIHKHMHQLSDWAEVRLVAVQGKRAFEWQTHLAPGKPIRIHIGYDQNFKTEFTGYIQTIENHNEEIRLYCQDYMYALARLPLQNRIFQRVRLSDLLNEALASEARAALKVSVSATLKRFQFDRFEIRDLSGYGLLRKLQDQSGLSVYVRDKTLYVGGRYEADSSVVGRRARYTEERHIEALRLRYPLNKGLENKSALDEAVVEVSGLTANKKVVMEGYGKSKKRPRLVISRPHISDPYTLQRIAKETHHIHHDHDSGHIHTLLYPYCTYGYGAALRLRHTNATYFVAGALLHLSREGGARRTLFLGPEIDF